MNKSLKKKSQHSEGRDRQISEFRVSLIYVIEVPGQQGYMERSCFKKQTKRKKKSRYDTLLFKKYRQNLQ